MIMHISAMSNSGFGSEDSHTMAVVFVTFLCVWVCEAVCVCVGTAGALEVREPVIYVLAEFVR